MKVKVRVNLHGIMTISSASLYEAKESPEPETPEEQHQQTEKEKLPEQNTMDTQQNDADPNAMDTGAAPAEVGTGSSWTKKISAWFSGVRILSRQRWPGNFVVRSTVS